MSVVVSQTQCAGCKGNVKPCCCWQRQLVALKGITLFGICIRFLFEAAGYSILITSL